MPDVECCWRGDAEASIHTPLLACAVLLVRSPLILRPAPPARLQCVNAPAYMKMACEKTCHLCHRNTLNIRSEDITASNIMMREKLKERGLEQEATIERARELTLQLLRHSKSCARIGNSTRKLPEETSLLYVGSDLDTYVLNFLACHETRIVFVDPLVWWRNAAAMREWYQKHPGDEAHQLQAFAGFAGDDGFYECPPRCDARPLTNIDQLDLASILAKGLSERKCSADDGNGWHSDFVRSVAHESGLSGFMLNRHHVASVPNANVDMGAAPAIEFSFESQGVQRTFQLYTTPAEKFNFSHVFRRHRVSTFVQAGVGNSHPDFAAAQLCGAGRFHPSLRLLTSFSMLGQPHPPPLCQRSEGHVPVGGVELRASQSLQPLACGCSYSGRNEVCYSFARYSADVPSRA